MTRRSDLASLPRSTRDEMIARVAVRRMGVSARHVKRAQQEAQRIRAQGGIASLGNVLQQDRAITTANASRLNQVEDSLNSGRHPQTALPERLELVETGTPYRLHLPPPPGGPAAWKETLNAVWDRFQAKWMTPVEGPERA